MRKAFPSVTSDQIAYAYDSSYLRSGRNGIGEHFEQFQVLGDGMCQHSPGYGIQSEQFTDYLQSLAVAMFADPELAKAVTYEFSGPSKSQMRFCETVRYRAPKDDGKYHPHPGGFYSLSEQKISNRDALRHDKRYEQVAEWMDGTPGAICRLLYCDWHTSFRSFVIAQTVRDWYADEHGSYTDMPHVPGKPECSYSERQDAHAAYQVCVSILESVRLLDSVEYQITRWKEIRNAAPAEDAA